MWSRTVDIFCDYKVNLNWNTYGGSFQMSFEKITFYKDDKTTTPPPSASSALVEEAVYISLGIFIGILISLFVCWFWLKIREFWRQRRESTATNQAAMLLIGERV